VGMLVSRKAAQAVAEQDEAENGGPSLFVFDVVAGVVTFSDLNADAAGREWRERGEYVEVPADVYEEWESVAARTPHVQVSGATVWPQTCCECGARVSEPASWAHHEVCAR
jgi:hypothetical protein